MDPFEELLQQLQEPIVLPAKPSTKEPVGDTLDMFMDTKAPFPQRLESLNNAIKSGAVDVSPSILALAQKMQEASDAQEDTIRNTNSTLANMMANVEELIGTEDEPNENYKLVSGEVQQFFDDLGLGIGHLSKSGRNIVSGGKAGLAESAMGTLASNAFLLNYEKLKGAGAISNSEGDTGRAAYNLLFYKDKDDNYQRKPGLSEEDTLRQLNIIRDILRKGQERIDNKIRWDATKQENVSAEVWMERNRSNGTDTGALQTPEDAAKETPKPEYTTIEKDTDAKSLAEGTKFYYQGKAYQKGPGLKIYILKE